MVKGQWTLHKLMYTLALLSLIPGAAGCGQSPAGATNNSNEDLQGTITISGAWALYPLMVRWGEEFQKLHPGVRFDISAGGAGKGMSDVLANAVDLGMVSREIYPEEVEKGAFWVSVTKDAVFPTANVNNPVSQSLREHGLAREALIGIYITGEITYWEQALGRSEAANSVHAFTRSDACGAAATWAEYLGGSQEDLKGVGVYGDPGLLDAVIKDPLAIGFNNLNYAFDMDSGKPVSGAWLIPIDVNGNGRADPEEVYDTKEQAVKAVAVGQYPSPPARELNVVSQGKPTGLVRTFLAWVLTDGQQYTGEAGYIALPEGKLADELGKLD